MPAANRPEPRERTGSRARIRRLALPAPVRYGLLALLIAALVFLWWPDPASQATPAVTWDSRRIVDGLLTFAILCAVASLVFFVGVPQTFGRKCPRDLTLLTMTEKVVVPGQVHVSGMGLAPILERTFTCRRCDFRHSEAVVDTSDRANFPSTWLKVPNWYARDPDGMSNKWEELRMQRAITDERYAELLAEAKEVAQAKSSADSPWHRQS